MNWAVTTAPTQARWDAMNDDDEFDPPRRSWRSRCVWTAIGAAGMIGFLIYRDWQPAPAKAPAAQLQIMRDPAATSPARHLAAVALGKTDGAAVGQVVPELLDDLAHGDDTLRFLAAVALTRLGAKALSAKPALIQATKDLEPRVRQQAVQGLAQITSDSEVVAALTAAARDTDGDVRGAALIALRFQQAPGAAALVALLADSDAGLRRRAAIELGRLPAHADITAPPLHQALANDDDYRVRAEALAALRKLSLLSIEEWSEACHDRNLRHTALAAFPTDAVAVPELRRLLTSEDVDVARQATFALGVIGPAAREAVDALLASLDDDRNQMASWVGSALGKIGLEGEHKPPELWDRLAEANDAKSLVLRDEVRSSPGMASQPLSPFPARPRRSRPPIGDRDMGNVAGLINLRYLDLAYTDVGDEGLAHLAGLAKLQWLDLSHTRVSSAGLAHLAGLSNLRGLWLDESRVTDEGLAHLKNLSRLERLQLNDTNVTDAGLAHLASLHALKSLMLGKTNVTDDGLAYLADLDKLTLLGLSATKITDAGMPHLAGLRQLKSLYLHRTAVTDAGLERLSQLEQLGKVGFDRGQFTTAGLAQLRSLTELRWIGPKIGDAELEPLSQLTHLKSLMLIGTSLTDAGLKHLAPLTDLTELALDDTATSDAGLVYLYPLIHLQTLSLTKTHVTENGIEQLKRALPDLSVSSDFGSDHYRAIGLQPAG